MGKFFFEISETSEQVKEMRADVFKRSGLQVGSVQYVVNTLKLVNDFDKI